MLSIASCLLVSKVAWPLQMLHGKANMNKLIPIWLEGNNSDKDIAESVTGFAEWCHGVKLYSFVRRSVASEGKLYSRGEHGFYKRVLGILY